MKIKIEDEADKTRKYNLSPSYVRKLKTHKYDHHYDYTSPDNYLESKRANGWGGYANKV